MDLDEMLGKHAYGFVFHFHACGREDLNDWAGEDGYHYYRAVHKLVPQIPGDIEAKIIYPLMRLEKMAFGGYLFRPEEDDMDVLEYGILAGEPGQLVESSAGQMHVLKMTVHTDRSAIRDSSLRRTGFPNLIVIGESQLILGAVELVKQRPHDYYPLIRALVPPESFPNVTRGIIDKAIPASMIYIIDLVTTRYAPQLGVLRRSDYDKFAIRIAVD